MAGGITTPQLVAAVANHGGVVAVGLKKFGEGLLGSIKSRTVVVKAVDMAVFAGEDDRPARPTDAVGTKGVAKQHPFFGDPVDIGRLIDF